MCGHSPTNRGRPGVVSPLGLDTYDGAHETSCLPNASRNRPEVSSYPVEVYEFGSEVKCLPFLVSRNRSTVDGNHPWVSGNGPTVSTNGSPVVRNVLRVVRDAPPVCRNALSDSRNRGSVLRNLQRVSGHFRIISGDRLRWDFSAVRRGSLSPVDSRGSSRVLECIGFQARRSHKRTFHSSRDLPQHQTWHP
jgi:hypothetical protein